jgi:predicted GNAT family acetyltransferase
MAAAGRFLAEREAEHNLILGIVSGLSDGDEPAPLLMTLAAEDGAVVGAAIQTPPYNLILSELDAADSPGRLAAELAGEPLPGVVGPPGAVRAFADAWARSAGVAWEVRREERIYRLHEVTEPARVPGSSRLADASDRPMLRRWLLQFAVEIMDEAEAGLTDRVLDGWERGNGRRFWFWEVDGTPVSMVSSSGRTPNGIRIGPVYTPTEQRGRGFASWLTAWVSQTMLDEGRAYCFLYTDLGNPTSNHIYQAIGYRPVTDALMVAFRARS